MKQTNIKTVLMFSLLALAGCKDKGGNSNPQPVAVPGVIAQNYSGGWNENCNLRANSYECNQNGQIVTRSFDSMQGLCNLVGNNQANNGIAPNARMAIYNAHQCQFGGINNNGMNGQCGPNAVMTMQGCVAQNGLNNGIHNNPNLKSVTCRLEIVRGNTSGDTGEMEVRVEPNNASGVNIFAFTNAEYRKRFFGIFNVAGNISSISEKLATVKMYYSTGKGKPDMIKLEANTDDIQKTSVTGYAGALTSLAIAPEINNDDVTSLRIECQSNQISTSAGNVEYKNYRCKGEEKNGSVTNKIEESNGFAYNEDFMNNRYDLYQGSKTAKVRFEGTLATGDGTIEFAQLSKYSTESSILTKANVTTPSAISVRRPGYRLDVECKPTNF